MSRQRVRRVPSSATRSAVDSGGTCLVANNREEGERTPTVAMGRPDVTAELGDDLTLWAESPEEGRIFLRKARGRGVRLSIARIFVAKLSGTTRTNRYIEGLYYRTSNNDAIDVLNDVVQAPRAIIDLVQWCTCDVMLSRGPLPILAFEDTTHIVRMNLYQRFPRLARAALLGVPSIILQGTRGLEFRLRGDRWGLFRYLQAFEAATRVHPATPPLPYWYLPDAPAEAAAEDLAFAHVQSLIAGDQGKLAADRAVSLAKIRKVLDDTDEPARDIPSIVHAGAAEVVVKVGAQPHRKSWREKGSGQMDPYLGLILAAKYIYCYDESGRKTRDLVVEFTYLPPDFWWFQNPTTTALYKRLPIEFADEVRFLG